MGAIEQEACPPRVSEHTDVFIDCSAVVVGLNKAYKGECGGLVTKAF